MQRTYELMLIAKPDLDLSDEKKQTELVTKMLGAVKIKELTSWGKKTLAYPIKKQKEGTYLLVKFESPDMRIDQLEKQVKLTELVMRYLLIRR